MAKQTFTTGQVLTAAQMTSLQQTAMLGGAASAKTASYTLVAADAGTAISMSSASATTITVNTALFAAGDTVQITNLGAGVCTITAGTATVNTSASLALAQYESGTLDFTSTSAAIFIKGAGAAASSSGVVLIGTTNFSGVASQSVNDVFSSTYDNYVIYVSDLIASTGSPNIYLRLRVSGTDNSSTQYALNYILRSSASLASGQSLNGDAWDFGNITSTQRTFREIKFSSVNKAQTTGMQTYSTDSYSNTTALTFAIAGGAHAVSTAYTGFTIYPSANNITGTISVYGVSK